MSTITRLAATLAVLAMSVAACATDPAPAPEPGADLVVTGTDALTFDPDVFRVRVGAQVTLEFTSEETINHTFTVEGADEGGTDLQVAAAAPGETVTTTFTIAEPGTFEVFCSVPGHREAGMVGVLTAEG